VAGVLLLTLPLAWVVEREVGRLLDTHPV